MDALVLFFKSLALLHALSIRNIFFLTIFYCPPIDFWKIRCWSIGGLSVWDILLIGFGSTLAISSTSMLDFQQFAYLLNIFFSLLSQLENYCCCSQCILKSLILSCFKTKWHCRLKLSTCWGEIGYGTGFIFWMNILYITLFFTMAVMLIFTGLAHFLVVPLLRAVNWNMKKPLFYSSKKSAAQ